MAGVTVAADSSPHNAQALCRYTPHHDEYVPPLVLLLYSWNRLPWLPVCVAEVGGKGLELAPLPGKQAADRAALSEVGSPYSAQRVYQVRACPVRAHTVLEYEVYMK